MSSESYHVEITICYENSYDQRLLEVLEKSLKAEVLNPIETATVTGIGFINNKKCLKIYERSNSLSHIRAATNSYLYLIHSIKKTIDMINNIKQH